MTPSMPLHLAAARAATLIEKLAPYCERIEIAGSIRRRRPNCNDIDLVCIPKIDTTEDLLRHRVGVTNHLHNHLLHNVATKSDTLRWVTGATNNTGDIYTLEVLEAGSIRVRYQIDIFTADANNYGGRLLCRTGSKEHNIWLAQRAAAQGGKYEGSKGLVCEDFRRVADTEANIYAALGLPFIEPVNRELDYLTKHFGQ